MGRNSTEDIAETNQATAVKIVSWMGGEHWYIGNVQYLRLEEAIAACERKGLRYEVVRDPNRYYNRDGD